MSVLKKNDTEVVFTKKEKTTNVFFKTFQNVYIFNYFAFWIYAEFIEYFYWRAHLLKLVYIYIYIYIQLVQIGPSSLTLSPAVPMIIIITIIHCFLQIL